MLTNINYYMKYIYIGLGIIILILLFVLFAKLIDIAKTLATYEPELINLEKNSTAMNEKMEYLENSFSNSYPLFIKIFGYLGIFKILKKNYKKTKSLPKAILASANKISSILKSA